MREWLDSAWQFSLVAFSSIFFLVDPFAAVPGFLAMTAAADKASRRRMAKRAALTCFVVLTAFMLVGGLIFKVFGITIPAFEIAGGLILLLIGIDMLQAKRSTQESATEEAAGAEKEDVGIIPLGIPMLAGPGTISTVMVLVGPHFSFDRAVPIFAAIALTSYLSYLVLAAADRVGRFLGEIGIRIMVRIFGLLLTAIAVQFVLNGLIHLNVIKLTE
jgi:multiple antibiotic resistance protein